MDLEVTHAVRRRVDLGPVWRIARRAGAVLRLPRGAEVELVLVTDVRMKQLNERTRGKAVTTDVLSFPLHAAARGRPGWKRDPDGVIRLGDIVISADTARRQAGKQGRALPREVAELFAHGLLHLLGYDHRTARERRTMETLARRLLGDGRRPGTPP